MTRKTINTINEMIKKMDECEERIEYLLKSINNNYYNSAKIEISTNAEPCKIFSLNEEETKMLIENYQEEILRIKDYLKTNYNIEVEE